MGALYSPTDDASTEAPPAAGALCTIALSEPATVSLAENAIRGGVVLTDATAATVNLTGGAVTCGEPECLDSGDPGYADWVAMDKPDCWCYPRQCHGDADGLLGGSAKAGYYAVGPLDLNILVAAWQVKEPDKGPGIASVENGICADFARDQGGSSKAGYYRVGPTDLNILVENWLVKEPDKGPGVPEDCGGDLVP
jgi:hypothetical protein